MRFLDCALNYLKKDADELAPLTVRIPNCLRK